MNKKTALYFRLIEEIHNCGHTYIKGGENYLQDYTCFMVYDRDHKIVFRFEFERKDTINDIAQILKNHWSCYLEGCLNK